MPSTFFSPYFLAGLLAVVFFFLTAALVGLSLFTATSSKVKLLRAESVALCLVTVFLIWLGWDMWGELQALRSVEEPDQKELGDWGRRLVSVMLLGIAVVFGSLIGCFGWVRAGYAGNGIRTVVWALIGVKMVMSSVTLIDLVAAASTKGDQGIPTGKLASIASPILDSIFNSMGTWAWICAAAFALSVGASLLLRRA